MVGVGTSLAAVAQVVPVRSVTAVVGVGPSLAAVAQVVLVRSVTAVVVVED